MNTSLTTSGTRGLPIGYRYPIGLETDPDGGHINQVWMDEPSPVLLSNRVSLCGLRSRFPVFGSNPECQHTDGHQFRATSQQRVYVVWYAGITNRIPVSDWHEMAVPGFWVGRIPSRDLSTLVADLRCHCPEFSPGADRLIPASKTSFETSFLFVWHNKKAQSDTGIRLCDTSPDFSLEACRHGWPAESVGLVP